MASDTFDTTSLSERLAAMSAADAESHVHKIIVGVDFGTTYTGKLPCERSKQG
jgi:hypothetical protein